MNYATERLLAAAKASLTAWENEEHSVREEHREIIDELEGAIFYFDAHGDPNPLFDYSHAGKPAAEARPRQVRNIAVRDVREIAPSLYVGRDCGDGALRLFDDDYCRGYVNAHPTPKKPNGWRVHAWPLRDCGGVHRSVRRVYPDRRSAERALIAAGLKLEAEAAEHFAAVEAAGRAAFRDCLQREHNPISEAHVYRSSRAAWFRGYDAAATEVYSATA